MKYTDAFSVFNNHAAKIFDVSQGSGYMDDDISLAEIGALEADFQPYRGSAEQREYGIYKDATAQIFTADNAGLLKVGRVAEVDGVIYDILSVEKWEMGDTALLKERN